MTVNFTVQLTDEELAALQREAEAQGLSVDELLRLAALQIIASSSKPKPHQEMSSEEFQRALEQIADLIPANIPAIPMEALRRENMYSREDDLYLDVL